MKQGPDLQRIEENMRTGSLAAHGFMGTDTRSLAAVLQADQVRLERLGITKEEMAARMRHFTEIGKEHLGQAIVVEGKYRVETIDHKGSILCPFAHDYQASKCNTHLTCLRTGRSIVWSDLNIHLVEEHGFFEGNGARFRLEPEELADILGLNPVR